MTGILAIVRRSAFIAIAILVASLAMPLAVRGATFTIVVGQTNGGTTTGVNQYNPASQSITAGDSVTWNSAADNRQHTVTSYAQTVAGTPDWDSGQMRSGTAVTTFSRTFSAAGTYTYYCDLHATRADAAPAVIDANIAAGLMVGKIVVAAAALDTTGPSSSALAVTPNPTNGAASAALTATITDTGSPQSTIAGAEYTVGASAGAAGSGAAMLAVDAGFNATTEAVSAAVPVTSYAAGTTITIWVRGRDAANNWGGAVSTSLAITAAPAGAVPASVTITGGSLSNSTYDAIPFGALSLTGADATLNASVGAFRAIDARGTGAGWNITVTATDFTSASGGIAVANFKLRLPQSNIVKISGNTIPTSSATSYQPLGGAPLKICTAGLGQGMGTYDYTPDFQLTVPAQTLAGTYQSVVTVTINSGP